MFYSSTYPAHSSKSLRNALQPQTREYIDWQGPLSGVHSIMIVVSVQPGQDGGARPPPFTISTLELPRPFNPPSKTRKLILPVPNLASLPFSPTVEKRGEQGQKLDIFFVESI
jgi:hypothetical protein